MRLIARNQLMLGVTRQALSSPRLWTTRVHQFIHSAGVGRPVNPVLENPAGFYRSPKSSLASRV